MDFELNYPLLKKCQKKGFKLVAVTKYWDAEQASLIANKLRENFPQLMIGVGENRVLTLAEKGWPRDHTHFIGRLQSRQLKEIVQHSSCVHSLDCWDHAQKLERICAEQHCSIKVFLQVNISAENSKGGVEPAAVKALSEQISALSRVQVLGLCALGENTADQTKKRQEFQRLEALRQTINKDWWLSAGTSADIETILELKITRLIVRLGRSLITEK